MKSVWNNSFVANKLNTIHELVRDNDEHVKQRQAEMVGTRSGGSRAVEEHVSIQNLRVYFKALADRFELDEATANAKEAAQAIKAKMYGNQKGVPIQMSLQWDASKRDKQDCPRCSHNFVMNVEDSVVIRAQNKKIRDDFERRMIDWGAKPQSQRGPKPKMKSGSVNSTLACMCSRLHCQNRPCGRGCDVCADFAAKGARPLFSFEGDCTCPVCSCDCTVYYARNKRDSVLTQTHDEKSGIDGQEQTHKGNTWCRTSCWLLLIIPCSNICFFVSIKLQFQSQI
jgi:hypothetical protein